MDDQLDDDLKNRIREVFENYEDVSADEGWMLLREKYPEKSKKRPIAWIWWSAAAMLLICLGILWFRNTPDNIQQLVNKKKHPAGDSISNIAANKSTNSADSSTLQANGQAIADNANSPSTNKGNKLNPAMQPGNNPAAIALNKRNSRTGIYPANAMPAAAGNTPANQANASAVKQGALIAAATPETQNNTSAATQNKTDLKVDTTAKTPAKTYVAAASAATAPGVNMQEEVNKSRKIFSDNNAVTANNADKPKKADKAVIFGVYAATYVNYAKGSSNEVNMGAGVSSDISLNKNLKLSTGVSIAQNTLSYSEQPPPSPSAQQSFIAVSSFAAKSYAAMSQYTAAAPTFKNYNASLLGLDIPLNLKFIVDPQKTGTYISAGFSSGTFLNESYVYSYNNPAPFSANVSQEQDQSTHQSFNSFYLFKTLNFSFGTGFPVGGNRLILEPFLKYPLDGLGSQQLRFGAGGLNLKFSFHK